MNVLKVDYEVALDMLNALVDNYKDDGYTLGDEANKIVKEFADYVAIEKITPLTDQEVFAEYFNFCLQVPYHCLLYTSPSPRD